ncbi:heterokaryon incompatibility protein-domain-containing protein [Apiospora arundinis]|uniref:Heterokaryon incompatibility protein-domain-containing protein n=1 Tax=Apiospora arundinis TaxID=335852 RepID=A0ABR2JH82_9PEZI
MPPKKEGHIYDLQETFARLRQTLPILDDLELPYEIHCYLHLIRVWCDEWEDLGIPFTPAFECLKGGEVDSQRILLMQKMIRAFHLLTGRKVSPARIEDYRKLVEATRQARERIQQTYRTHSLPWGKEKVVVVGEEEEEEEVVVVEVGGDFLRQLELPIEFATRLLKEAWQDLMATGEDALRDGMPDFRWWDYENEVSIAGYVQRSANVIIDSIKCVRMPSLDGATVEARAGPVPMRRLLQVVTRRHRFLVALQSNYSRSILPYVEPSFQKAFKNMDRTLPPKPGKNKESKCNFCSEKPGHVLSTKLQEKVDKTVGSKDSDGTVGSKGVRWTDEAWRKHVFEHLRPFVCLIDECRVPHRTWAAREGWERHIFEAHCETIWPCPVVSCMPGAQPNLESFIGVKSLARHLREDHALDYSKLLGVLHDSTAREKQIHISPRMKRCPLCLVGTESLEGYVGHVGDHLECIALMSEAPARPLWLIDTELECIVPAEAVVDEYLALSYVWGGVESGQLTRETIDRFQRPVIFTQSTNPDVVVPKTIRHAMALVRILKKRYLWVDRFCICQDDAATKHSQLQIMGNIYHGAYLTIVAASGWDADHGLTGLKGLTEPRNVSPYMDSHLYADLLDLNYSIWHSRGWTFQEGLFSRRTLIFRYQVLNTILDWRGNTTLAI